MIGIDTNILLRLWLNAVLSLLEEIAFAFQDREAVAAALSLFEAGSCGFADCLVVAKHARRGCDFTATFDRDMRKLPRGSRCTDLTWSSARP